MDLTRLHTASPHHQGLGYSLCEHHVHVTCTSRNAELSERREVTCPALSAVFSSPYQADVASIGRIVVVVRTVVRLMTATTSATNLGVLVRTSAPRQ